MRTLDPSDLARHADSSDRHTSHSGAARAAERLIHRSETLAPADRALISDYYLRRLSLTEIARLRGLAPVTISRRLRALRTALLSPRTSYILAQRHHWPPDRRAIAEFRYLHLLSLRATARAANLSLHRVRMLSLQIEAELSACVPHRSS